MEQGENCRAAVTLRKSHSYPLSPYRGTHLNECNTFSVFLDHTILHHLFLTNTPLKGMDSSLRPFFFGTSRSIVLCSFLEGWHCTFDL